MTQNTFVPSFLRTLFASELKELVVVAVKARLLFRPALENSFSLRFIPQRRGGESSWLKS